MNIFKKIYCRTFQFAFKIMLPFLPYREPTLLASNSEVADVLKKHGKKNILLATDKGLSSLNLYDSLLKELKQSGINVFVYDKTVPNPTSQNVEDALKVYRENKCDAIIAFGGGSPIDLAKATAARAAYPNKTLKQMKGLLKVRKKLPLLIAVPTTAGTGSETTLTAVITDSETRHKYTINSFPLIPNFALLDANLTTGLPPHITSTTGLDALTHAVESYIGNTTTKQTRQKALSSIKLIFENLETAYLNGKNLKARQNMLLASYNAGVAFTKSYVGYVHAVAHSLGGKYNTAHGLANAVILPYMLKFYGKSVHKKLWQIGLYVGFFDKTTSYENGAAVTISKIEELCKKLNIQAKFNFIKKEDIPALAQTAEHEANPLYPVPKLFDAKELEKIYYQISEI